MLLRGWSFPVSAPSGSAADAAAEELDDVGQDDPTPETEQVEAEAEDIVAEEPEAPTKSLADYGLPEDPEVLAREYAQYKQQASNAQRQLEAFYWQQQQAAQQNRPAPEKPKLPWGDAPEYSRDWLQQITRDENGNIVSLPGHPPTRPDQVRAYNEWTAQAAHKFFSDPVSALNELFMPEIERKAQEIASRQYQQLEQRRALQEYENQNRELYFTNGQLNELGNHFNVVYNQAVQAGFGDPLKVAHDAVDAALFRANLQQQKQPTREQQQTEFLKKAAKGPGKQVPTKGRKPASTAKDPWARLRENLKELPEEDFIKD